MPAQFAVFWKDVRISSSAAAGSGCLLVWVCWRTAFLAKKSVQLSFNWPKAEGTSDGETHLTRGLFGFFLYINNIKITKCQCKYMFAELWELSVHVSLKNGALVCHLWS